MVGDSDRFKREFVLRRRQRQPRCSRRWAMSYLRGPLEQIRADGGADAGSSLRLHRTLVDEPHGSEHSPVMPPVAKESPSVGGSGRRG